MMKIGTLFRKWKILSISFLGMVMMLTQLPFVMAGVDHAGDQILLELALHKISLKYDVHFNYDRNIMNDVMVDYEEDNAFSLAEALDHVFENTHFGYRVFEERYIVVFENNDEGTESLKNMINHMQDLVEERESVKKRVVQPVGRLSTLSAKDLYHKRIVFSVSGTVMDEDGEPLIGVNIQVKGSNKGTSTDFDGNFNLEDIDENAVLVVSYVGYQTKEIPVEGKTSLEIVMTSDSQLLDEVVVVGYGTVKKSDLTGSVASVKGSDLTAFPVSDPIMALQGRASGVHIYKNTGAPDDDYTIRIRGVNSIKGDNSPLYIVDGIPFSNYTINPYDIESIEILKDASATAIYGSRGANGVVIISTKRGKEGKAKINYNYEYGRQSLIKKLDLMDAPEWAKFYNEYLVNSGTLDKPAFTDQEIQSMGKGTDWQDEMFTSAPIQTHNISISGGTADIKYIVNGSALFRSGLIPNSSFDKYNLNTALDFSPTSYLDVSLIMGYSKVDRLNQSNSGGNGGSSMIGAVYSASPLFTIYDENGEYKDLRSWFSWSSHEIKNPMNMAYNSLYQTDSDISNMNASINLKPFNGFSIRSILGLENNTSRYDAYTNSDYIYNNNSASVNMNRYNTLVNENIMNYNLEIDDVHTINIMGGATYQQYVQKGISGSGNTFISDKPITNALSSAGTINTPSTSYSKWALISFLGRVNYNLRDKYLFTVSFRTDGSSRYSPGQKWGYFPSGAFAWRVSNERFMTEFNNISDLKFRVSYGKTGSTAISPYSTQNLLNIGKTALGNGNFTNYAPPSIYPGDLKWETTSQYDVGIDLSLLDFRLNFTADYYIKHTTDLLNTVFLPSSSGYTSSTENIGEMKNSGIEIDLDGAIIRKRDLQINGSINISSNKNKVIKLADGDDIFGTIFNNYGSGPINIIREGEPLGAFYLYKDGGINETGQITYVDMNDDGLFTDTEDRYIAGYPYPKFLYGFNMDIRYKNFALNFLIQGIHGNKVFNLSEMRNLAYSQGMNIERKVYYNSWREGGDNKNVLYPKIEETGGLRYSDRFLEDGSFLRLRNISLAYFIPSTIINWTESANIFVSLQNYLTLTKYTGVDPEVSSKGSDINQAIDHLSYPNSKSVTFGIKFEF